MISLPTNPKENNRRQIPVDKVTPETPTKWPNENDNTILLIAETGANIVCNFNSSKPLTNIATHWPTANNTDVNNIAKSKLISGIASLLTSKVTSWGENITNNIPAQADHVKLIKIDILNVKVGYKNLPTRM